MCLIICCYIQDEQFGTKMSKNKTSPLCTLPSFNLNYVLKNYKLAKNVLFLVLIVDLISTPSMANNKVATLYDKPMYIISPHQSGFTHRIQSSRPDQSQLRVHLTEFSTCLTKQNTRFSSHIQTYQKLWFKLTTAKLPQSSLHQQKCLKLFDKMIPSQHGTIHPTSSSSTWKQTSYTYPSGAFSIKNSIKAFHTLKTDIPLKLKVQEGDKKTQIFPLHIDISFSCLYIRKPHKNPLIHFSLPSPISIIPQNLSCNVAGVHSTSFFKPHCTINNPDLPASRISQRFDSNVECNLSQTRKNCNLNFNQNESSRSTISKKLFTSVKNKHHQSPDKLKPPSSSSAQTSLLINIIISLCSLLSHLFFFISFDYYSLPFFSI
ncbi:hypothetical protein VP01_2698g1 [Puccinia sorghi]|uniref:Uncharacterized protein n=1 Tax=Puccinia sorghi TaxID=27349 RepID=A0A0L6V4G7_9BASI|nr:hypothetical protein VP01_2698g1 [Puccinia sorghi]